MTHLQKGLYIQETESTWYVGHCWPIVPAPDDRWWLWSNWWNEYWQGKLKYSEKSCPSATLSTTNPTCPDLGSNPGHRGWKPATNRLSYGTAYAAVSCIRTFNYLIKSIILASPTISVHLFHTSEVRRNCSHFTSKGRLNIVCLVCFVTGV
jgi:hypothetical protein